MDKLNLKVPPVIVFLVCLALVVMIDHYAPTLYNLSTPFVIVIALVVVGALLGLAGVLQFSLRSTSVNPHRPENASSLITNGVYRFTRNPMYLALLLLLVAGILKFGSLIGLIVLPLFIWYMNRFQIIPEENVMQEKFGDEFSVYKKKVRRWI